MNKSLKELSHPQMHGRKEENSNMKKRSRDVMEDGGSLAADNSPKDALSNDEGINKTKKRHLEGSLDEGQQRGEKYLEGSSDEEHQTGENYLEGSSETGENHLVGSSDEEHQTGENHLDGSSDEEHQTGETHLEGSSDEEMGKYIDLDLDDYMEGEREAEKLFLERLSAEICSGEELMNDSSVELVEDSDCDCDSEFDSKFGGDSLNISSKLRKLRWGHVFC